MNASRRPERGVHKTVEYQAGDQALQRHLVAPRSHKVLVAIAGPSLGQRFEVHQTLTIGRHPNSDIALSDGQISSFHARLEDRGDSWTLVDLNSTNGTFVNGTRCTEVALRAQDKVLLGETVLRFEVRDPLEQQYDAQVEQMMNIDDLSGLFVRRKFDAELARIVESAEGTGTSVGLLVMDLDGIKKINDAHGHLFGAYVIAEAGKLIGRTLGTRGIACRFGGDEYLAALPGLDLTATTDVGKEILAAIHQAPFVREGVVLKPGISIGVAAFPSSARDPISLFQRGDEALYRAKSAGKNTIRA
jgi:diguanylate cyclase (GGDEF)-like protein